MTENTRQSNMYEILIEELELQDLPEEMQDEFVSRYGSLVFDAVINESLLELSQEEQEELMNIMNSDDDDTALTIITFLDEHVTDLEELMRSQANIIKRRLKVLDQEE